MSEYTNMRDNRANIRWKLLSTVSAFALLASTYTAGAADNDADRPLIWIELGGQMENVSGQGEIFAPAFLAANPNSPVLQRTTPLQAQLHPPFSFGEEAKISFQPENSDWVFSVAGRIGRSSDFRDIDHQTNKTHAKYVIDHRTFGYTVADFAETQTRHKESHAILDFLVGKDVGLGMFGRESSSTLGVGVRFAQFSSSATLDIRARPDLNVVYFTALAGAFREPQFYFHTYHATGHASRNFHGVGPSLSWNGSAPFAGNSQGGEIALDWGANAALLFGRQKARVRHQETAHYYDGNLFQGIPRYQRYSEVYQHPVGGHSGSRSVTVPNVGGFAGISFRRGDAKVSFGYRADFFFGAMDTGIDAAKKSNLAFNGPYASISVGIGD